MGALAEAIAMARGGAVEKAIAEFERILASEPTNYEARIWLSMLLRRQGDLSRALEHARFLAEARPHESLVRSNLGLILFDLGRNQESIPEFVAAIELNPQATNNYLPLAKSFQRLSRDQEAVEWLTKAKAKIPGSADIRVALAQSLLALGRPELARTELEGIDRSTDESELLLAGALVELGQTEEALPRLQRLSASPDPSVRAYALTSKGMVLASSGQIDAAERAFTESIEGLPNQAFAYLALVRNRTVDDSRRSVVDKMESLISSQTLSPKDVSMLHYGLGKAREDLGEFDAAMDHFHEANAITKRLKGKSAEFDVNEYRAGIGRLMSLFPPEIFRRAHCPSDSSAPIFVLGMMRSGTTLVEQILSSHGQVNAGGENPFWMEALEACRAPDGEIDLARVDAKAAEYVAGLGDALHTTDKMPANYLRIGLIHLALPNAKIVHVKRNAQDTCLSIYTTPSSAVHPWLNDAENIAAAHREYVRLMRYWEQTVPDDRLITLRYEDLVSSPEPTIRRVLEFCGLPWEAACLSPERNTRSVITPSMWQVRKPIYTQSVSRWNRFQKKVNAFSQLSDI